MIVIFHFFNKTRNKLMNLFTFSKHFKHVDVYTNDGMGWIGFRLSSDGITYSILEKISAHNLAIIAGNTPTTEAVIGLEVHWRPHFAWMPLSIPMCNEMARLVSGVNIGWTSNPGHLYRKLIKYDNRRNYEILYHWRRMDVQSR